MIVPRYAIPAWFHGLDLGQRQDYTALASLELLWTYTGHCPVTFEHNWTPTLNLCGLRRYPLGTSYADYPKIVASRLRQVDMVNGARAHLIVDAGGPGGPVIDELRRAHLTAEIHPMLITGGNSPGYAANGYKTVPRRDLISNIVLLLDHQVLRWSDKLPLRLVLEQELLNLNGGTTQPASSEEHDDLVMAVAIAAWHAKCVSPEIMPRPNDDGSRRWSPQGPLF